MDPQRFDSPGSGVALTKQIRHPDAMTWQKIVNVSRFFCESGSGENWPPASISFVLIKDSKKFQKKTCPHDVSVINLPQGIGSYQ
jgi:hypothetical protein